jgi:hypothetical protein
MPRTRSAIARLAFLAAVAGLAGPPNVTFADALDTCLIRDAELITSGPAAGTSALAISGDTVVVGVSSLRAAFVFVRVAPGVWIQEAQLASPDGAAAGTFGFSVDIDGDLLVVGDRTAPNPGAFCRGAAHVFRRSGSAGSGVWTPEARLREGQGSSCGFQYFGTSVAISGNRVVVGATEDLAAEFAGGFVIFERSGEPQTPTWTAVAADGGATDTELGTCVAIDGAFVAAGAPGEGHDVADDDPFSDSYAEVFERTNPSGSGTWQRRAVVADGVAYDRFGRTVALSGGALLVGRAGASDAAGNRVGAVNFYGRSGSGMWGLRQRVFNPGGRTGSAIDVSGDVAAVLAWDTDTTGGQQGSILIYRLVGTPDSGTWQHRATVVHPQSPRGGPLYRLSLSGNALVIRAAGGTGGPGPALYYFPDVTDVPDTCEPGACCVAGTCTSGFAEQCERFVCNVADHLPATFSGCRGDADGNGAVNAGDRGFVAAAIGATDEVSLCRFDMDGNGVINAADRGFVSSVIGLCEPLPDYQDGSGLNAGVPDPRYPIKTFLGAGTACDSAACP